MMLQNRESLMRFIIFTDFEKNKFKDLPPQQIETIRLLLNVMKVPGGNSKHARQKAQVALEFIDKNKDTLKVILSQTPCRLSDKKSISMIIFSECLTDSKCKSHSELRYQFISIFEEELSGSRNYTMNPNDRLPNIIYTDAMAFFQHAKAKELRLYLNLIFPKKEKELINKRAQIGLTAISPKGYTELMYLLMGNKQNTIIAIRQYIKYLEKVNKPSIAYDPFGHLEEQYVLERANYRILKDYLFYREQSLTDSAFYVNNDPACKTNNCICKQPIALTWLNSKHPRLYASQIDVKKVIFRLRNDKYTTIETLINDAITLHKIDRKNYVPRLGDFSSLISNTIGVQLLRIYFFEYTKFSLLSFNIFSYICRFINKEIIINTKSREHYLKTVTKEIEEEINTHARFAQNTRFAQNKKQETYEKLVDKFPRSEEEIREKINKGESVTQPKFSIINNSMLFKKRKRPREIQGSNKRHAPEVENDENQPPPNIGNY